MLRNFALFLIFILLIMPSQAASMNTTSVSQPASGNCGIQSNFSFELHGSYRGTNSDSPAGDNVGVVLFDGHGTAIGMVNELFAVGSSSTSLAITINLQVVPQARLFTVKFFETIAPETITTAPTYPLIDSFRFDPANLGLCSFLPYFAAEDSDSPAHFTDDRINNFDLANPIVVYGHDFEDGRGLVIYSPEGLLLLTVTGEEMVECTGETILLKSGNGIWVYRLDTCEYQINTPSLDGAKTYVLIFSEPYPNIGYSSHEE